MSDFPAIYIVHTVNGPTPACGVHAAGIRNIMNFLGAHTNFTPAPEGSECENCKNAAERES